MIVKQLGVLDKELKDEGYNEQVLPSSMEIVHLICIPMPTVHKK